MKDPIDEGSAFSSLSPTRRELLKAVSATAAGVALGVRPNMLTDSDNLPTSPVVAPTALTHRYLLGWVNDNSSRALEGKRWPITDVTDETVKEYDRYLRVAKEAGYNGITLWGLYASHSWKLPLKDALEPERRRRLDKILRTADRLGIKILYGLGVYSWGFEEIIRHDPSTAKNEGRRAWGGFASDNGVAMCYHSPSARQWMRDIIDLCAKEIGTHGFGFQSGDLGRCFCRECQALTDIEYHSRVIDETAQYVRANYKDQVLGMSAWGVDLGGGVDSLREMGSHLDFLTDVTDQSARMGGGYRRELASALPCAIGSLGGAVIVPPQRWKRDRWFLPHAKMTSESIHSLAADGGTAFEYFMGPLNNPQYNLMTRFVGLLLSQPNLSCEQALSQVVETVFEPSGSTARDAIVAWLLAAEQAYMSRVGDISTGEFDFEPLKGETAGDPIYLSRLSKETLESYGKELTLLAEQLPSLTSACRRRTEIDRIAACTKNILADVSRVKAVAK